MIKHNDKSGFTLAEIITALTIMALLLSAVATAIHASLTSYKENEKIAAAMQTARSVLDRMTRDVRTAQAVAYASGVLTIIPPADGSGVTEIQYEYSSPDLLYRVTKSGTQTTHTLVGGSDEVQVSSFTIQDEPGKDWQEYDCTKSVLFQVTLSIDGKTFTTTASARPRRNLLY
jgi:prepilin-type N-terminal cleavage/methylation domain-containing protein